MFGIRLDEILAMYKVKKQMSASTAAMKNSYTGEGQDDLKFCYGILPDVSRSFAAVIAALNEELRDAICIFYLALRALDTIEDDMAVSVSEKKESLPIFHTHLTDKDWCLGGIGKGRERELLEKFYHVSRVFLTLKPQYQEVIADITYKMSLGMCRFLEDTVKNTEDYDLYCHYVAGLVGHGLTRLFAYSGLEDPSIADDLEISNSMGLFLQKANIIRDYYEDVMEDPPRLFWPKDIWGHFGETIFDFKDRANEARAKECLNAMVCDALRHVPHCIEYMASLKETSVLRFCAIPQVMAIATLVCVYNNYDTFHVKRKIRKGLACKVMLNCDSLESALSQFSFHLTELQKMLVEEDPSYDLSLARITEGQRLIEEAISKSRADNAVFKKSRSFFGVDVNGQSWARTFLTRYPALGGAVLYSFVDSMTTYFGKGARNGNVATPSN